MTSSYSQMEDYHTFFQLVLFNFLEKIFCKDFNVNSFYVRWALPELDTAKLQLVLPISLVPPSSFILMSLTCVCWMFIEIYFLFFSAFHWEIKLSKANYTESQKFSELEVHFFFISYMRPRTNYQKCVSSIPAVCFFDVSNSGEGVHLYKLISHSCLKS